VQFSETETQIMIGQGTDKFLVENDRYKVYSISENIYLKNKSNSKNLCDFEKTDDYVACIYGDPQNAIFIDNGKILVISGCGITLYNTETKTEISFYNNPDDILWTNGLHQEESQNKLTQFRFVALNKNNQTRVFNFDITTNLCNEVG
jgi:hypothetical protein